MSYVVSICRAVSAFLGALLIAFASAALVIGLPIWVAACTYGSQRMLDAPAHDGAFAIITMIFTLPVAFVFSPGLLGYLTAVFYQYLGAPKVR